MKKKLFKRVLALFLSLLTVFGTMGAGMTAYAAEVREDVYIINYPRAKDSNQSGWSHNELHFIGGWKAKKQTSFGLRAIGGYENEIAYCIEPGIGQHTGDSLTNKGPDFWDYVPNNQTINTDEIQTLIGRIGIYGYAGKLSLNWVSTNSSDADKLGNAIATQMLIWETVVGERDANFNKVNAHNYGYDAVIDIIQSNNPIRSYIMNHYNRIASAVQEHTRKPNFNASLPVELKYDGSKYTATLTDSNNVISKFDVSAPSGISCSVSGNKLTISSANPPSGTVNISFSKRNCQMKSAVIWSDGVIDPKSNTIQDVITYEQAIKDPVNASISVKVSAGNCKLVKESEDGFTEGFSFNIKGASVDKNLKTDKNGTWTLNSIPAGDYVITENLTEEQSRYVQPQSQKVTVTAGQTVSVKFKNELKRGTAKFQKTDLETDKEIESKDGVFGVYSWDKNKKDYERVEQMTYSEKDKAYITSDLPVTYKNDGKYKVLEEVAPTGYANPTKVEYEFQITEDGQIHSINDGTVTNIPQKGRVHIDKRGEALDSFDFMQTEFGLKYSPIYKEKSLANSVWEIRAREDIIVNGEVKYQKDELVETLTTAADGATSKPLYLGKYLLKEVEAPTGYFIGSNEFEIELTYHDQSIDVFTESYTGYNDRQKVKVALQKEIEENIYYPNPEAYKDIIFGIFLAEDITDEDENVLLEKDSLVDCLGLNDGGQGVSATDLPCGTKWYVKELQTAEGYILNTTEYPFEFAPQPQDIPLLWIDLNENDTVIENKVIKGNVDLIKKSDFDDKLLENAVYGIFRASDDYKVDEIVTDKNGYAKSNVDLYYGEYYIKELTPPPHYYIDENVYYFFIGEDGEEYKTIHYDFTDTPKIGALTPLYKEHGLKDDVGGMHSPYTGDDSAVPFKISIALLLASSGFFLVLGIKKMRSRKKDNVIHYSS